MRKEVNDVTYSIIGILASILLVIINQDIIINQDRQTLTKTQRYYRWFLLGMLAYLITDLLWGVLYSNHLIVLLYADTSIHFIAMVGAVMLWTQYVVSYLDNGSAFERMLQIAGRAFFTSLKTSWNDSGRLKNNINTATSTFGGGRFMFDSFV